MIFAVKLADLKSQPFQYVPAQPIMVEGKKYQTFLAYDPAFELIHVELRWQPTTKQEGKP